MNSLGFIETLGLIAAIEAADTMVKSANVSLLTKTYVGKGLVTVIVEGDVGAVKAAVDAGIAAVNDMGGSLHSHHVIPSPVQELDMFLDEVRLADKGNVGESDGLSGGGEAISPSSDDVSKEEKTLPKEDAVKDLNGVEALDTDETDDVLLPEITFDSKDEIDKAVSKYGIEAVIKSLQNLTNKQLHRCISEFDDKSKGGINLSKANKKQLLAYIEEFYKNKESDMHN